EPQASSQEPVRHRAGEEAPMPDQLSPRRIRRRLLEFAAIGAAIATVVLAVPGLSELRTRLAHASLPWLALAPILEGLSVLSYVVLFRAVFFSRMRSRVSPPIALSDWAANCPLAARGCAGL